MYQDDLTPKQREILARRAAEREKAKKRSSGERAKKSRKILLTFVLLVVILSVAATLVCTVWFRVSNIEVSGDSVYSGDEIIAAAGISTGDKLISIDKEKAASDITEKLMYIDSASVTIKIPNKVIIKVEPVQNNFAFYKDGIYLVASEQLKIFDAVQSPDPQSYIMVNVPLEGESVQGSYISFADSDQKEIFDLINELVSSSKISGITHIFEDENGGINLIYDSRIVWKIGDIADAEKKLAFAYTVCSSGENMPGDFIGTLDLSDYSKDDPSIRSRNRSINSYMDKYFPSSDTVAEPPADSSADLSADQSVSEGSESESGDNDGDNAQSDLSDTSSVADEADGTSD